MLKQRYQILKELGSGGMGITYSAFDSETNNLVAIKKVTLKNAENWKILELFQREIETLATLNHDNIPRYIDSFEIDSESDIEFYLVRQLIQGNCLSDLINQRHNFGIGEVSYIAEKVLAALDYLHSFNPFIIHRDIKPENIILSKDNRVFLIDFGGIQNIVRNENSFASTLVGTYGYMPPEQFAGKVLPSSDLYSLGCTLIYLLTKRHPSELETTRLKLDLRKIFVNFNLSNEFIDWLDKLIEPFPEDRYASAKLALQGLKPFLQQQSKPLKDSLSKLDNYQNNKTKKLSKAKQKPKFASIVYKKVTPNYLQIYGNDSHSFHPIAIGFESGKYSITLKCHDLENKVSGLIENLDFLLVGENAKLPEESMHCMFTDRNNSYIFGTGLSNEERLELFQTIRELILENQS